MLRFIKSIQSLLSAPSERRKCEICDQDAVACKGQVVPKRLVRSKETGCKGWAEDKGDHIEITFIEGRVKTSSLYAKCVLFREYVILSSVD